MARRMVSGNEVYRVVVTQKGRRRNPAYVRGGTEPYLLWDQPEERYEYGPYTLGGARGVLTQNACKPLWMTNGVKELKDHIIRAWIEKAETTWSEVE